MKKIMICSMMCLMTMFAKAQVLTSATIQKVFESVTMEEDNGFSYNAERDNEGRITAMEVYRKKANREGDVVLTPALRYLYTYTGDGLLSSRTKYVWHGNSWRCFSRHDYSLKDHLYSVDYSRWNKKKGDFSQLIGRMTYTLQPDQTVETVACYYRHNRKGSLELAWQTEIVPPSVGMDYYLTRK